MSRKLKIEERGDYHAGKTIPTIRLKGKWLQAAGFPPGSSVRLRVYAPGCMDIRLESVPQLMADDFTPMTETTCAQRRLHAKIARREAATNE